MAEDAFEDILDGYFPLAVSIRDLMERRGVQTCQLTLRHAPILTVPGLPPDAPVPLNIRSGRAGLIRFARIFVKCDAENVRLRGFANWRWLDTVAPPRCLDPMVRLAEPCLVQADPLTNREFLGPAAQDLISATADV